MNQFDMDNSCISLVKLVKENMNDPDSFQHVETTYEDKGIGVGFYVHMKYRGNNAFGGVVTEIVSADANYIGNSIEIIDSN